MRFLRWFAMPARLRHGTGRGQPHRGLLPGG
jgi:hypothetical protein